MTTSTSTNAARALIARMQAELDADYPQAQQPAPTAAPSQPWQMPKPKKLDGMIVHNTWGDVDLNEAQPYIAAHGKRAPGRGQTVVHQAIVRWPTKGGFDAVLTACGSQIDYAQKWTDRPNQYQPCWDCQYLLEEATR